jgi:DtxR family Mn-dependent transcriptional regulator
MPSATLEEYLEAIYKLGEDGEVRPTAVSETLGVSAPTVTSTLRRLEERGWVERPGGGVVLTTAGREEALSIIRRHRLAERFLVDVLGLGWDEVHEEACRLEHAMSPKVQTALERFLEYPERCPHGHPIPDAELSIAADPGVELTEVRPGEHGRVVSVREEDEEILRHLHGLGVMPGAEVLVVEAAPPDGTLLVRVGERDTPVGVGLASSVRVEVLRQKEPSGE